MGKRRDWISTKLKNIFLCKSKEDIKKKIRKSANCLGKHKRKHSTSGAGNAVVVPASNPPTVEMNSIAAEDEHHRHDADVPRVTSIDHNLGINVDKEVAAIKIQTAFRGYLARRALSAMKSFARLKSFVEGQHPKCQSAIALNYMQRRAHLQSGVCGMRIRMPESNSSLQRQIQKQPEKKLEESRASETWRNSPSLPNYLWWGWRWSQQQLGSQPRTYGSTVDRVVNRSQVSIRSIASRDGKLQSPKAQKRSQLPSTPNSGKLMHPSRFTNAKNDDSNSIESIKSDRCWRPSLAGSCMGENTSLASCPVSSRGYMASTVSSRAKSRSPSLLGKTPMKPTGSARKRLSFSTPPSGEPSVPLEVGAISQVRVDDHTREENREQV